MPPKKKNTWFEKIETRDGALKAIKDSSYLFFFVSIFQIVIKFALGTDLRLDAILYLIFGGILLKFKSKIAAILLLLLSSGVLVMAFINRINLDSSPRTGVASLFMPIIMIWASVRAIQATFKLSKLGKI